MAVGGVSGCLPSELIRDRGEARRIDDGVEAEVEAELVSARNSEPSRESSREPVLELATDRPRAQPRPSGLARTPSSVGAGPSGSAIVGIDDTMGPRVDGAGGARVEARNSPQNPPPKSIPPSSSPVTRLPSPNRSGTKNNDPNAEKIQSFLQGWVSSEYGDEVESFFVRRQEATTFAADRYHTLITTTGDHAYNITVDVYHEGKIRVFKSQKLH
jgi:hypothetical protein